MGSELTAELEVLSAANRTPLSSRESSGVGGPYILAVARREVLEFPAWYTACEIDDDIRNRLVETTQKGVAMKTIAHNSQTMKAEWAKGASGSRSATIWMEWQELKFILVSVGLPVLLVALVVQLVPHLLRLF
jgi:hypothetical protein